MTKEEILAALRQVEDPDLKKDLVTLNMVENIQIEGDTVSFDVVLTTPACPLKNQIQQACIDAVHQYAAPHAMV
ncbi:MAG TPA: iron-sulfur cluster assembly protein, partial [Bacteroidales bacterium]|nr:iron-sulfur cluster assembly protein [Bacteroidales bacterium]